MRNRTPIATRGIACAHNESPKNFYDPPLPPIPLHTQEPFFAPTLHDSPNSFNYNKQFIRSIRGTPTGVKRDSLHQFPSPPATPDPRTTTRLIRATRCYLLDPFQISIAPFSHSIIHSQKEKRAEDFFYLMRSKRWSEFLPSFSKSIKAHKGFLFLFIYHYDNSTSNIESGTSLSLWFWNRVLRLTASRLRSRRSGC